MIDFMIGMIVGVLLIFGMAMMGGDNNEKD
jgi:hypothetical protein